MATQITAKYFKDNTDYDAPGTILDNIGSDRTIDKKLNIKNFTLSTNGRLQATICISDMSAEIANIIQSHQGALELRNQNELHVDTNIRNKNLKNDGVLFFVPSTFDANGELQERGYGVSIDRRTNS